MAGYKTKNVFIVSKKMTLVFKYIHGGIGWNMENNKKEELWRDKFINISNENKEDIVLFLQKALSDINVEKNDMWDGLTVSLVRNLLNSSAKDMESLKEMVINKADEMIKADISEPEAVLALEYTTAPCILFTAYKLTGSDIYKEKIIQLEKSDLRMGLAFDMLYETAFGGKEHYHAITVEFDELAKKNRTSDMEKAMFMIALIDTIEAIDQPVYELYRKLVDIFRDEMKSIVVLAKEAGLMDKKQLLKDVLASAILSCTLKKACDMKVVLAEKYSAFI